MDATVQPVGLHKLRQLQMISEESRRDTLAFRHTSAYHIAMLPPERTMRQRIIEFLTDTPMTTHQLARALGISERQVEEHLAHVVKTVARDLSRRFILEPSICLDCGFMFRDRTRLTRPSRCPHCRSEGISVPCYRIESLASGPAQRGTQVSRRSNSGKGCV